MTKRPSLLSGLNLPKTEAAAAPAEAPVQPAATRKPRPDIVHTSVYLPKVVHRKLREIAFTTDRKVHDLLMDGVDHVLRAHGHAGVEDLKRKS